MSYQMSKYDPKDLFLDGYDSSEWSENEEKLADKEDMKIYRRCRI